MVGTKLPDNPTKGQFAKWLEDNVLKALATQFANLVEEGDAVWLLDPEVDGVFGLQRVSDRAILMVIYGWGSDFETADAADEYWIGG